MAKQMYYIGINILSKHINLFNHVSFIFVANKKIVFRKPLFYLLDWIHFFDVMVDIKQ